MATAIVTLSSLLDSAVVNRTPRPKRVVLRQTDVRRRRFEFPFGPKEIRYEGEGIDYINIERPGLVSLLEADSTKARVISFTAVIANQANGGKSSVETNINLLNIMAKEDIDLTFTYGVRSLNYRVRITDISTNSVQRDLDGNITQATVDIQLTERPRRTIDPVTLNAIRYTPPASTKPAKKTTRTTTSSTKPSTTSSGTASVRVDRIVQIPGGGVRVGGSTFT